MAQYKLNSGGPDLGPANTRTRLVLFLADLKIKIDPMTSVAFTWLTTSGLVQYHYFPFICVYKVEE